MLAGVAETAKSWLLAGLLASILAGLLAGMAGVPAFLAVVFMCFLQFAISGVPAHPMQHMQATRLPGSWLPASLATRRIRAWAGSREAACRLCARHGKEVGTADKEKAVHA